LNGSRERHKLGIKRRGERFKTLDPPARDEFRSARNPASYWKPTPGLEPGTPSLRGIARVDNGVLPCPRGGRKALHVARTAVDYSGRLRTAVDRVMYAESTRALTTTKTT